MIYVTLLIMLMLSGVMADLETITYTLDIDEAQRLDVAASLNADVELWTDVINNYIKPEDNSAWTHGDPHNWIGMGSAFNPSSYEDRTVGEMLARMVCQDGGPFTNAWEQERVHKIFKFASETRTTFNPTDSCNPDDELLGVIQNCHFGELTFTANNYYNTRKIVFQRDGTTVSQHIARQMGDISIKPIVQNINDLVQYLSFPAQDISEWDFTGTGECPQSGDSLFDKFDFSQTDANTKFIYDVDTNINWLPWDMNKFLPSDNTFKSMFKNSNFNQDINTWAIQEGHPCSNFMEMFAYTPYNKDITKWLQPSTACPKFVVGGDAANNIAYFVFYSAMHFNYRDEFLAVWGQPDGYTTLNIATYAFAACFVDDDCGTCSQINNDANNNLQPVPYTCFNGEASTSTLECSGPECTESDCCTTYECHENAHLINGQIYYQTATGTNDCDLSVSKTHIGVGTDCSNGPALAGDTIYFSTLDPPFSACDAQLDNAVYESFKAALLATPDGQTCFVQV